MHADKAINLILDSAEAMRNTGLRNGQLLHLPSQGSLYVAGDIHNHTRNYEKFKRQAALKENPDRHVILQELIHGGALGSQGEDDSIGVLLDALEWSRHFPDRVHMILANHDWAQAHQMPVMKDGYDLTDRFTRGLAVRFGNRAADVAGAFRELVYSMPLAAITATGILFSHSLPSPHELDRFDVTILRRPLVEEDYRRNGPVYQLIWGRFQTQAVLDRLSRAWWTDLFVCGHQTQESGVGKIGSQMLLLDSCHNHGYFLPVELQRQYTLEDLRQAARPFAAYL